MPILYLRGHWADAIQRHTEGIIAFCALTRLEMRGLPAAHTARGTGAGPAKAAATSSGARAESQSAIVA